MKRTWTRVLMLILALTLVMGAAFGCGKKDGGSGGAGGAAGQEIKDPGRPGVPEGVKTTKDIKVALILEGSVTDMNWNYTANEGLKKIAAMGAQTKYVENIPASSVTDTIDTFAGEGFNVIFLATNSYATAAEQVIPKHPEIMFFVINAGVTLDNARSFAIQDAQHGYMMGALCALVSKSNKVGFIGGLAIKPIINGGIGFEQGAKYVNPDIEVKVENTGNFDNVMDAKELAKAFIGQGVDALAPMANQASRGVMEAAEEKQVAVVAPSPKMKEVAPKMAVAEVFKDTSIAYEAAFKAFIENEMPMEVLPMGAAQGVIHINEWLKSDIDQQVKDKMVEIEGKLKSGEITIKLD